MANFLMLGKYSLESMKGISSERTKQAVELIQNSGGKVNSIYALLGSYDLALLVEFPSIKDAMKASVSLTKLTNISFTTLPAIAVEEFDQLVGQ